MTATEALERRIDELCRENERLRQQVASIIGRSIRTADKMYCLDTENAKLRELVRDMRTCIDHACMCEFCPLFVTEEDMGERRCIADVKTRLRELGIEVN